MKNYLSTILLLGGIIIGGLVGVVSPGAAEVLTPFGDIFIHLLFTLIVPMVFFSISSAIYDLSKEHLVGKVLGASVGVFATLMLISALLGYLGLWLYNPLHGMDISDFLGDEGLGNINRQNWQALLVDSLTVSDFGDLLSTDHILPLLVASMLIGAATAQTGEYGHRFARCLKAGNEVVMKALDLIMQLAPFGLGCYFAGMVSTLGEQLFGGYLRITLLYCVITLVLAVVVFPLLSILALGKGNIGKYVQALMQPILVAVSSLSSSACMPANMQACRNLGVSNSVCESVVPLGTNLHKCGSVVSSVLKIGFVMLLSGIDIYTPEAFAQLVGFGILASIVVGAVPTGAGTSELLICALIGVDPMWMGLLMIVSTLFDIPGTVTNVLGNLTAGILVGRLTKTEVK